MPFIIIFCFLFVTGVGLSLLFRCKAAQGVALSLFSFFAFGYLLALLGLLNILVYLAWLVFALCAAFAIYKLFKDKGLPWVDIIFTAIAFGAVLFLMWWVCRGRAFSDWDDFSHWGISVKEMFFTNMLYTAQNSATEFRSYPPATQIVQYLFLKLTTPIFREDIVQFANCSIIAVLVLYISSAFNLRKRWFSALLSCGMLALLPLLIEPVSYTKLSVDVILGILFACVMFSALFMEKTKSSLFLQCLFCMAMALLKGAGFALSAMAGVALIALFLLQNGIKHTLKQWAIIALPLISAVGAKLFWSAHLLLMGVNNKWDVASTALTQTQQAQVATSFFAEIFGFVYFPYLINVTFAIIVLFAALLLVLACVLCDKKQRKVFICTSAISLLSSVLFTISLLFSYFYVFSAAEALNLSSIYRYLNTAIMMLLFFAMPALFLALSQRNWKWQALSVATCVLVILSTHSFYTKNTIHYAATYSAQTNHDMYLARRAAQRINSIPDEAPRVYIVTGNDAGAVRMKIEYEYYPKRFPKHSSIIQENIPENEPWVTQKSAEDFSRELCEGFDYLYIYDAETQFINEYKHIFEDESKVGVNMLFKVIPQANGTAKLSFVS